MLAILADSRRPHSRTKCQITRPIPIYNMGPLKKVPPYEEDSHEGSGGEDNYSHMPYRERTKPCKRTHVSGEGRLTDNDNSDPNERTYEIEEVIKGRHLKCKDISYLVKWKGYKSKVRINSWVRRSNMTESTIKLIDQNPVQMMGKHSIIN